MISFPIFTWRCSHCGSVRDSDPFDAEVEKVLKFGAPLGMCHYCYSGNERVVEKNHRGSLCAMERISSSKEMLKMTFLEPDDIDRIISEHRAKTNVVKTGRKLFRHANNAEPGVMEQFDEERDETPEEKTERINKIIADMKPATQEYIAEMRTKHEYKP